MLEIMNTRQRMSTKSRHSQKNHLTKNKIFAIIIIENEREEKTMDAIVVIMMMGIIFFGVVGFFCGIIDFFVRLEEGRRALDQKCAERKQAVEELLEIRRNSIEE